MYSLNSEYNCITLKWSACVRKARDYIVKHLLQCTMVCCRCNNDNKWITDQ